MWRPDGWNNPYIRTSEKPMPDNMADEVDDAYEEGADEILQVLMEDGLWLDLDNTPLDSRGELIATWLYPLKGRGSLIFIPADDTP